MKKYIIVFVIILIAMVTLIGNSTSKHITFPFAKTDIVEVEMYHYEGVPAAEECKIITRRNDIDTLHKEFQSIKVRDRKKGSEPMTGGSVTRFIFILSDGTEYDLEYCNSGMNPSLISKVGAYEYQTSANLEKYWTKLDYELVETEEIKVTEWSTQEIEALFLDNNESDWKLIKCVSAYDFAYDRIGVVLFTEKDTEYINVAFMDEEGIMPHCGIEATLDENIELTYHGNGEVTFNVCSKDGVKYKQKFAFSKYNDEVKFVSESMEY